MFHGCFTALAALVWLVVQLTCAVGAERVAMVIGNADYRNVSRLPNPVNDATDMAAALSRLGFEVTVERNLSFDGLRRALQEFGDRSAGSDMAVIFYAGHGVEIDRQNYVVPVDARLRSDRDVPFEALPLDMMLAAVDGARSLKLVLLDACRDNPFVNQMRVTSPSRSVGRGLARIEPSAGTLVGFAAKEGTIADDGKGRNSPYTAALLAHLDQPGLEINLLFRRVRDQVLAATGGRQQPFTYGSLPGTEIFLNPQSGPAPDLEAKVPVPAPQPQRQGQDHAREAWEAVALTNSRGVLEAFIDEFPDSVYAKFARARLKELPAAAVINPPPASKPPPPHTALPPPRPGDWLVIAGSFVRSEKWKADQRVNLLRRAGVDARIIDTDDYGNLRNGLWAVVVGPFNRTSAEQALAQTRPTIPDAYIKQAH